MTTSELFQPAKDAIFVSALPLATRDSSSRLPSKASHRELRSSPPMAQAVIIIKARELKLELASSAY